MAAQNEMSWGGIGVRFVIALLLVFVSYNPGGYSYFDWLFTAEGGSLALKVFAGVVLIIGWAIYVRATLRSLGGVGLLLATAFFVTLLWLLSTRGIIPADSFQAIVYLAEVVIAALLATGMVWSHLRRRMTGQVDVDEIEDN